MADAAAVHEAAVPAAALAEAVRVVVLAAVVRVAALAEAVPVAALAVAVLAAVALPAAFLPVAVLVVVFLEAAVLAALGKSQGQHIRLSELGNHPSLRMFPSSPGSPSDLRMFLSGLEIGLLDHQIVPFVPGIRLLDYRFPFGF